MSFYNPNPMNAQPVPMTTQQKAVANARAEALRAHRRAWYASIRAGEALPANDRAATAAYNQVMAEAGFAEFS